MSDGDRRYPETAYAPNGALWWELEQTPGANRAFGDEQKISAWLYHNVRVNRTFTMEDLREALGGDDERNTAEHLNRRLRSLRNRDGWVIHTAKDERALGTGVYRVVQTGWHPGTGIERPVADAISAAVRRRVIDRDGSRCQVCGVGDGEPYPREPGTSASLTAGHIIPRERGGTSEESNLRAECKRCNEPVRDEMPDPPTFDEVLPDVRRLKTAELRRLLEWLDRQQRTRDRLDEVYDRIRKMAPPDKDRMHQEVRRMLGGDQP